MPRPVSFDYLQYEYLVVGDRELGQCEHGTLPLVSAHDSRGVAHAQHFERRALLGCTFSDLLVFDVEMSVIDFKEMFVALAMLV